MFFFFFQNCDIPLWSCDWLRLNCKKCLQNPAWQPAVLLCHTGLLSGFVRKKSKKVYSNYAEESKRCQSMHAKLQIWTALSSSADRGFQKEQPAWWACCRLVPASSSSTAQREMQQTGFWSLFFRGLACMRHLSVSCMPLLPSPHMFSNLFEE